MKTLIVLFFKFITEFLNSSSVEVWIGLKSDSSSRWYWDDGTNELVSSPMWCFHDNPNTEADPANSPGLCAIRRADGCFAVQNCSSANFQHVCEIDFYGENAVIVSEVQTAGEKGEQGEKGQQGEKGAQGEQGLNGLDGLKGAQGEQGLLGPMGSRGEKGERGDRSLNGEKGEKGGLGQQGEKGSSGENGIAGDKGQSGDKGKDGRDGKDGLNGEKGQNGAPADKGEKGSEGLQGEKGQVGEKGAGFDFKMFGECLNGWDMFAKNCYKVNVNTRLVNLGISRAVCRLVEQNDQSYLLTIRNQEEFDFVKEFIAKRVNQPYNFVVSFFFFFLF